MAFDTNLGILETQEDVFSRILSLDEHLKTLELEGKFNDQLSFIIFGGTALLLYSGYRVTSDIDCYYLSSITIEEVQSIIAEHGVNNRIENVMQFPEPEDFIGRSKEIFVSDQIEVRIASREDLILSKLLSTRGTDRDEKDLIESDILDNVDLDYIREKFEEYKDFRIGAGVNFSSLDDIINERVKRREKIRV
ncbi:DUF6036 family nucleotidyltransferase [Metabacillus herbersteinensis]|uniref:DUF6036 family nucleotidyltransferase n=1 Tax=Metabacillus herbersteinensis TaxID=283816 RepID=A0ABV6GJ75_9BACI